MASATTYIQLLVPRPLSAACKSLSLSILPAIRAYATQQLGPYLELARVNKPAGVLAIYPPYLLGSLVYRAQVAANSRLQSVGFHPLLLLSAFVLRSAGCVWNDVVDRGVDRLVERSKSRPVARGAISPGVGTVYFGVLTLLWLSIVYLISAAAVPLASSNIPAVLLYPYAKRFTDFPQAILGITLAWGMYTGYAMARAGPLPAWSEDQDLHVALLSVGAAWVMFTLFYDTIYAYQDIQDDRQAGVRSAALRLGAWGKPVLTLIAALQLVFSLIAGQQMLWGPFYHVNCILTALACFCILAKVNLKDPRSCAMWFKRSLVIISALMSLGVSFARAGIWD